MSTTFLLTNGVVVTPRLDTRPHQFEVIPEGSLAWQDDRITAVGPAQALERQFPSAKRLDARGGLMLPGFVNLHHHFYSALARGLDPRTPMRTFPEVLDRLWWRLDRALDSETVALSAQLSAAACIQAGCTTVFDHHASPSCIDGSLDTIAAAMEEARLAAVLCYEITDRNGHDGAVAGLEENLRFMRQTEGQSRIRGVIGLHASFTIREETWRLVAAKRPEHGGCHIHVAEDPIDVSASKASFGVDPVERLAQAGLLDARCLLAHGIHLDERHYDQIARHGGTVITNPESNANNGVGRLDVVKVAERGCLVGLGTDGMSSSMLRALRFAFLNHRGSRRDPSVGFEALPDLLVTNAHVARRFLDEPLLGELAPGAPADIVVVDAPPPTTIDSANAFGHLIYGASEAPVRHTVAAGRVVFEDFQHTVLDAERRAARARERSPALWDRFHALQWGTSFLGT